LKLFLHTNSAWKNITKTQFDVKFVENLYPWRSYSEEEKVVVAFVLAYWVMLNENGILKGK
jgi:hypothetical protein